LELIQVMRRFWRGELPLSGTFWLGWAVPFAATYLLVATGGWWIINNVGLLTFYSITAALLIYILVSIVPVWRASVVFAGPKGLLYAARVLALAGGLLPVLVVASIVIAFLTIDDTHDATRTAERTATPSESHPMAGFWKQECQQNFGLAIAPADAQTYSVSFCGPGGCFKPGTYRSNTSLVTDDKYDVVDTTTLRVYGHDGWSTYRRYGAREPRECPEK
jgi:hypothetical protein